uniref:Resistance protein n=1 Tax=Geladintestivirus 1 TaxID=3233133 RepID=A0AAU8MGC7_9CAUD
MNIFEIEENILNLLQQIDENYGEITPEIEEQLAVNEENFISKVKQYVNVIKQLKSDIDLIKCEKDRLKDLENSKNNTIARLTKIVAECIETFGDTNKSGSKFLDLGTSKITVKTTQAVEVDDTAIRGLTNSIKALFENSIYFKADTLEDINFESVVRNHYMEVNNAIVCNLPTETDIKNSKLTIAFDVDLAEIRNGNADALLDLAKKYIFTAKVSMNKKDLKEDISTSNVSNFGKIVTNKSLIVR